MQGFDIFFCRATTTLHAIPRPHEHRMINLPFCQDICQFTIIFCGFPCGQGQWRVFSPKLFIQLVTCINLLSISCLPESRWFQGSIFFLCISCLVGWIIFFTLGWWSAPDLLIMNTTILLRMEDVQEFFVLEPQIKHEYWKPKTKVWQNLNWPRPSFLIPGLGPSPSSAFCSGLVESSIISDLIASFLCDQEALRTGFFVRRKFEIYHTITMLNSLAILHLTSDTLCQNLQCLHWIGLAWFVKVCGNSFIDCLVNWLSHLQCWIQDKMQDVRKWLSWIRVIRGGNLFFFKELRRWCYLVWSGPGPCFVFSLWLHKIELPNECWCRNTFGEN